MRAVLALALLVSLSSCKNNADDAVAKEPPEKVRLAAVEKQPSPRELTLTGLLAADQRSEVTADTQGKVVAVLVERGQRVKMGQPVVQLDVRTAALSAREAQANLAAARAQKQLAEEECRRAQALLDKGAITRSEYDRQSTQCTSTLQQVSAAQARADMISKSINDGLVRAPFDGVVTQKSVSPGEWVAPGRTLFTLVDDDPLKIELSVPEASVPHIQLGQKVTLVAVAHKDKRYSATVSRIGGEIGRTRSLIVEATLDRRPEQSGDEGGGQGVGHGVGATDLVPGMFAEAHVVIDQEMRPVVPADAVIRDGRIDYVFVARDGELRKTLVQVGPEAAPGTRAILKGLDGGEKVVTGLKLIHEDPSKDAKAAATSKSGKAEGKNGKAEGKSDNAASKGNGATNRRKRWVVVAVGGKDIEIKDGLRVEELPVTPDTKAADAKPPESKAPDAAAVEATAPDAKPATVEAPQARTAE
jgi:membrane fusion protein (multidrug efflux system)